MRNDALRTIFTADEHFNDVRRMRIWARLAPRLPTNAAAPRRWPWLVAAGVLAAALVAFVIHRPTEGALHVVPANGVLAMPLGPATRAALVGPGELLVVEAGERTAVELRGGTLYGEFTGAPGRSLRIEANGAVIEVVGTLFSVTATAKGTCVAVAHGRVKFTSRGVTTYVGGGQQACAGRATAPSPIHPLDTTTHDALARFDRTWFATSEPPPPAPTEAPHEAAGPPPVVAPAAVPVATPVAAPSSAPVAPPVAAPSSAPVAAPSVAERHAAVAPGRVASAPRAVAPAVTASATSPAADGSAAPTAEPEPPSADALYRAADDALARGDAATADRALADLLARDPDSALADEALYERARLAFARGDWTATRRFVEEVASHESSALREPASYLGCRAALNARADDAQQCFADYIAAFPSGAHVGDARAQLRRGAP